jgi:hypothetical protein
MMTKCDNGLSSTAKASIEEVLHATQGHLMALRRHARKNDPDAMRDVLEGMGISVEKLRLLLKSKQAAKPTIRIVVSVSGGSVTGVMSSNPHVSAEVFDFDDHIERLANGEFADQPSTAKAAERAEKDFAEVASGMTDALAAKANKKGRVQA